MRVSKVICLGKERWVCVCSRMIVVGITWSTRGRILCTNRSHRARQSPFMVKEGGG